MGIKRNCTGVQELETLQLNNQCMCLNKKKIPWQVYSVKHEKAGLYALPFQQIPFVRCFCKDFFLSSFRHSELLNNIPGFGKWAYLNIHLTIAFNVNDFIYISSSVFTSHFTAISAKSSITARWLRIAPIKFLNSSSANSRLRCFSRKTPFFYC